MNDSFRISAMYQSSGWIRVERTKSQKSWPDCLTRHSRDFSGRPGSSDCPGVKELPVFVGRPPELFLLARFRVSARDGSLIIVYPDPPLGNEELQLFTDAAHGVRLHSVTEWLGESCT